jgi:hypothetical protein
MYVAGEEEGEKGRREREEGGRSKRGVYSDSFSEKEKGSRHF